MPSGSNPNPPDKPGELKGHQYSDKNALINAITTLEAAGLEWIAFVAVYKEK